MDTLTRCHWVTADPLYIAYHDREWGVPVYDDRRLFEFLILEGAQAGLSWLTVLKKRDRYRTVFDGFNAEKMAGYGESEIQKLLMDTGIIRNRKKIEAAVCNARAFLDVCSRANSFAEYIWQFIGGAPRKNSWSAPEQVPAATPEAEAMSRDLKKRGFRFVGPTICYAYMQAVGMVNDHLTRCFRYDML